MATCSPAERGDSVEHPDDLRLIEERHRRSRAAQRVLHQLVQPLVAG